MKAVWKFPLMWLPEQTVNLPDGAWVLSCGLQGRMPVVWALVDPAQEKFIPRRLVIVPTGAHRSDMEKVAFVGRLTNEAHEEYHVFVERN